MGPSKEGLVADDAGLGRESRLAPGGRQVRRVLCNWASVYKLCTLARTPYALRGAGAGALLRRIAFLQHARARNQLQLHDVDAEVISGGH